MYDLTREKPHPRKSLNLGYQLHHIHHLKDSLKAQETMLTSVYKETEAMIPILVVFSGPFLI